METTASATPDVTTTTEAATAPTAPSGEAKTISVRLPGELSRAIEVLAKHRGGTVSDLIRSALEIHLWPPAPRPVMYVAAGVANGSVSFQFGPGLMPGGQYVGPSTPTEAFGQGSAFDLWVAQPPQQPRLPGLGE
jgi:hypothetical protein